ncbi:MAG: hypothetical protein WBA77_07605 [Microcoleaceae cyanobacterium]
MADLLCCEVESCHGCVPALFLIWRSQVHHTVLRLLNISFFLCTNSNTDLIIVAGYSQVAFLGLMQLILITSFESLVGVFGKFNTSTAKILLKKYIDFRKKVAQLQNTI